MRVLFAALLMAASLSGQDAPALAISGVADRGGVPKDPVSFTLADLKHMARATTATKNQKGEAETYEGVLLSELMKRAGLPMGEELRGGLLASFIVAYAHDGYRVVFTLPDADPAYSDARILVADTLNGAPLTLRDGPLRLIVPADKRPARWLRMLNRLEVVHTEPPVR